MNDDKTAHSVVLSNGTVIRSDESPGARYDKIAASIGAPPAPKPPGITFGPSGHPPLPCENPGAVVVDEATLQKVNAVWRDMGASAREEKREVFRRDLKLIFEGRIASESVSEFYQRTAPSSVTPEKMTEYVKARMTDDGWIK